MKTDETWSIHFDARSFLKRLLIFLVVIELGLLWADVFLNMHEWAGSRALRRAFNITREDGLPNWFASLQMFFVGLAVWLVYFFHRAHSPQQLWTRRGWAVIASFFTYLAMDDAAKLHERIGTTFKGLARSGEFPLFEGLLTYSSYTWQVVLGPVFALFGAFILLFLWRHLSVGRRWIVVAFALYALAIFMDYLEGRRGMIYQHIAGVFSTQKAIVVHYAKALEEVIEMFATSLFLMVFLRHFFEQCRSLQLKWSVESQTPKD